MIKLPKVSLPQPIRTQLKNWQDMIDALPAYPDKVWREMKRTAQLIPELSALFRQAPEALKW